MSKQLSDEEVVRFARATVTEVTAGTFVETAVDTQLSIERGVIWMIHAIDYQIPSGSFVMSAIAASANVVHRAQLTRESQAAIVNMGDPDLIDCSHTILQRSAAIGTDAGPLWILHNGLTQHVFPIPIPYAAQQIFFGFAGTTPITMSVAMRVHYTIRSVTDAYFYRVAQALIG